MIACVLCSRQLQKLVRDGKQQIVHIKVCTNCIQHIGKKLRSFIDLVLLPLDLHQVFKDTAVSEENIKQTKKKIQWWKV